jgi:hypothetical protein
VSRVGNVQRLPDLPRWEEKFPLSVLQAKASGREEGGSAMWLQGFRMQVMKPGDRKFPSFESCWEHGLVLSELWRREMPVYVGVDLSSSKRPGNFIVATAVDQSSGRRIPIEARHGNWTSPETAEVLTDVCSHHPNLQFVVVENNAYQESLIDWVKQGKRDFPWWMKIEAHTTGANKADPTYGLPGLEVEFANRAWAWPSGEWEGHGQGHDCSWCLLKREFTLFPKYSTFDGIMATWFTKAAIDKWGSIPRGARARRDWNRR